MNTTRQNYRVVGKTQETPVVATLLLSREDGKPLSFVPGQYVTVYLPETGTLEGKSYSLSSAPLDDSFSITVKAMGEFSNQLYNLDVGDIIEASLPYGFFYSDSDSDMVLIAAGIGVAPFRSMIRHHQDKKIILHYSLKKKEDAIFKKEFDALKRLSVTYYFTQEGSRRIDPNKLVMSLPDLKSPEFFICGGIAFVRDMWKGLQKSGVPEEAIYTEAFF